MASQLSVLVIDDDPDILLTLTAYLEDSGYVVYAAMDGEEGLEIFARSHPDVVVTDLRMPKRDGFEVIAAITAESPTTAVIALTGTGECHVSEQVAKLGAWCCLYKPLTDLNDLVVAIELSHAKNREGS